MLAPKWISYLVEWILSGICFTSSWLLTPLLIALVLFRRSPAGNWASLQSSLAGYCFLCFLCCWVALLGCYCHQTFICDRLKEFISLSKNTQGMVAKAYNQVDIKSIPPEEGWYCLNTDGAFKGQGGITGCGGLFRNINGKWIWGFSRNLGKESVFVASCGVFFFKGSSLFFIKGLIRLLFK